MPLRCSAVFSPLHPRPHSGVSMAQVALVTSAQHAPPQPAPAAAPAPPSRLPSWAALSALLPLRRRTPPAAAASASAASASASARSPHLGVVAVISAAVLSGLAGVWTEARVKRTAHVSVAVRNVQLGLASLAAGACSVCWLDAEAVRQRGLFAGFTPLVWLVVLQVAAGGLIIGVVHKHADNIAKGFATSLSILLSSALSALLPSLRFSPSPRFLLGAVLVVAATAVYCLSTDAPSGTLEKNVTTKENGQTEPWCRGVEARCRGCRAAVEG
uniref:Uncharacterized protein n=1 Tax=Emiliania huxleyi TaxID=2903 RepID=A0A7S3W754_EMIHU